MEIQMKIEELKIKYESNKDIKIFFDTVQWAGEYVNNYHNSYGSDVNNINKAVDLLKANNITLSKDEAGLGLAYYSLTQKSSKDLRDIHFFHGFIKESEGYRDIALNIMEKIEVENPSETFISLMENRISNDLIKSFYNSNKDKINNNVVSSYIESTLPKDYTDNQKKEKVTEILLRFDNRDFLSSNDIQSSFSKKLKNVKNQIGNEDINPNNSTSFKFKK